MDTNLLKESKETIMSLLNIIQEQMDTIEFLNSKVADLEYDMDYVKKQGYIKQKKLVPSIQPH